MRPGPNQVGPKGWLQSLTDGLKLPFKEEIIPKTADKVVYFIAPMISASGVRRVLGDPVRAGGVDLRAPDRAAAHRRAGIGAGAAGLLLDGRLRHRAGRLGVRVDVPAAGWPAVQRPDDLVRGGDGPGHRGGVHDRRHDVHLEIVAAQGNGQSSVDILGWHPTAPSWYAILLLPSFIIYCIAAVGETNRAPFDLPEAESSWSPVSTLNTSSLKFALFFLTQYIAMVTMSALYHDAVPGRLARPSPITHFWQGANSGWWPMLWFFVKVFIPAVRLHLVACHAAPAALRPVHAVRLEGPACRSAWPGSSSSRASGAPTKSWATRERFGERPAASRGRSC